MTAQASLDTLLDLAGEQRDQAAATLGRLHSDHAEHQSQLDALLAYRSEYRQQMNEAMRAGLDMGRLNNYKRFLTALDGAIEQQRSAVRASDARVDQGRAHWRDRERRVKSFDTLVERRRTAARRRGDQIEQNINDEHAERSYARGQRP